MASDRGLRELGYVDGESVVTEYRSADGRDERSRAGGEGPEHV